MKRALDLLSATARLVVASIFLWLGVGLRVAAQSEIEIASPPLSGKAVYNQHCQHCHGANGEGVEGEYEEALTGNRSIQSLARRIARTMPEDDPDLCLGKDAEAVATYIYHEFYSAEARRRNGLVPRVELSRLTVSQYRNAVADLVSWFTPQSDLSLNAPKNQEEKIQPGLRGTYYESKGMSKANDRKLERVDTSIAFNFGELGPIPEINPEQFSIVWEGGLVANETGYYEFRIRSQNGTRLYINSENTGRRSRLRDDSSVKGQSALIDGWVSSGKPRLLSGRLFLLGGREYPIRLEFFKYKEKTASVQLEWKQPHGVWQDLDDQFTNTSSPTRIFVVETPFPADDRSTGYERGASISPEWHNATTSAAVETADEVINRLPLLSGYEEGKQESLQKLRVFVKEFASVAFRRPLTAGEERLFGEILFTKASSPEAALRQAILFTLKSPSFLYLDLQPETATPSNFALASRLSFFLMDSIPDRALRATAIEGKLEQGQILLAEAQRLIKNPRTKAKLRGFFDEWLEIGERDLAKDKALFPQFDEYTIADLKRSLTLFVEHEVWQDDADYRDLLMSEQLFLNERLRSLYHPTNSKPQATSQDSGFMPIKFNPDERSGLLTHPYLLSAFAYHNNTSPIHRGVFLTRNIIGRGLKPPPEAVAFKDDEFAPNSSMREKITSLTRDTACMACHSVINPLGFVLENYDAVGRWRTSDKNRPIDSTAQYETERGDSIEIQSARDIARFAATNPVAHQAFITHLFHHMVKQSPDAYGAQMGEELRLQFARDGFNIRTLMARIAAGASGHAIESGDKQMAQYENATH